jgi:hypothetical protein
MVPLASTRSGWQIDPMERWCVVVLMGLIASACSVEAPRACSPPRSAWGQPRSFGLVALNTIALDRSGRTYWNGKEVARDVLGRNLAQGAHLEPQPWIFLETEMGAPCDAVEAVRNQVERHVDCSTDRCNEGIKAVWNNVPAAPGAPIS